MKPDSQDWLKIPKNAHLRAKHRLYSSNEEFKSYNVQIVSSVTFKIFLTSSKVGASA